MFSGDFQEPYKKCKCLDFLPGALKKLPALQHYHPMVKLRPQATGKSNK